MIRKKGTGKHYRIVVRSELCDRYASAFEGMRMQTQEGQTILTGLVKDQPHLFGVLDCINGLGLELLSVQALPEDSQRTPTMRVLVAFEDVRSVYSDIFARAIRLQRPRLDVRSSVLKELERDLVRFDPHVVVCSRPPNGTHLSMRRGAWVHIPTDDGLKDDERLARIWLNGKHWRTEGPSLSALLEVVDETHERLREGALSGVGCVPSELGQVRP